MKYQQYKKTVYELDKTLKVRGYTYQCVNVTCDWFEKPIKPEIEGLKYSSVGWTLLLWIAIQRVYRSKPADTIEHELREEYGIGITDRSILNLTDKFLQLVGNKPHPTVINELKARGNNIISVDGIMPQKGNVTLYLVREVISGRLLLARMIPNSSKQHLVGFLHELKEMELPIVGFVSDKQSSLVLAELFPEIDHQYCQYHFLRNIGKKFEERDLGLRKKIRKRFRPIYQTEKTAKNTLKRGEISNKQFLVLQEFYCLLKAISRRSCKYSFKSVGIPLYEATVKLRDLLVRIKSTKHLIFFETIEKHLDGIIKTQFREYQLAIKQFDLIHQINDLLKVEVLTPSKRLRNRSEKKLSNWVEMQQTSLNPKLHGWWEEVKKQTRAFLPGLFSYCSQPLLPRTNNDMEQFIKEVKKKFKRLLGREFIHRFFLRRGEFWLFSLELFEIANGFEDKMLMNWLTRNGCTIPPQASS